ncbi:MAG: hydroxyacid dehydrogenase [Acidimicrobium sp.]|nr:hydroxyacid dehydrogenase [Ilumatobacteraceae bacterium]PHX73074.1 MAG: hydroxyacid dehydrogenase [Acidimicrobium sp.]
MQPPSSRAIAVQPPNSPEWVRDAVVAGGGHIVEPADASAIVWTAAQNASGLREILDANDHLEWVQVPFAGIENFVPVLDDNRVWTCGKGVYAEPVAEHALALALAGMRNVSGYSRSSQWTGPVGHNLLGAAVTIVGGGGITESLIRLLTPFGCNVTVVRRTVEDIDGADTVVGQENLVDALAGADVVFLALSLTPETVGLIGKPELEVMEAHAWIINVARGRHIVTDDLVWALENNVIGGAALDVTDPEPLPENHPLWSLANCIITPHVGNTPEMAVPLLSARITENVKRFLNDERLIGLVDVRHGY